MKSAQESFILASLCGFVVILSLAGLLWAVLSGQLLTFDGLLLALTCLTMGGVFSLMLFFVAKGAGWLDRPPLPRRKLVPSAAEGSANPPAGKSS